VRGCALACQLRSILCAAHECSCSVVYLTSLSTGVLFPEQEPEICGLAVDYTTLAQACSGLAGYWI